MHRLVGTVFSKLHDLDPDSEEKKLSCTPPLGTDQLSGDIAIASQPGTTGKSKKKKKKPVTPIVQGPARCVQGNLQKSGCKSLLFPPIICPSIDLCLRWTPDDR
jgi:hypothetical protein